ncbi:MAG: hypothetical protein P9M11_11075 [Candidatus Tenebribacter burtonii]|jgi:hypothetical protein|nr:hypothetical protein [Candidatus Tenebribacter burtonii]
MIFKSINIKHGYNRREIDFSNRVNLIFSTKNSVGKTTLLRLLLYSLGYAIPHTKGLPFKECEVETIIESQKITYRIVRNIDYLEVYYNKQKRNFSLPIELYEFHALLFNTKNEDILSNMLASFYVDQEKGWTLLNRGSVIGKNKLDIEKLVRGLADIDCSKYYKDLKIIERELLKYREMFNVSEYQNRIHELKEDLVFEKYDEVLDKEIILLNFEKRSISDEVKKIDNILENNKSFIEYIENMKINVRGSNGELIPVNKTTILEYDNIMDVLLTKKKMKFSQMAKISKKLNSLQNKKNEDEYLFKTTSVIQQFDESILSIPINPVKVKEIINSLEKKQSRLRKRISSMTKLNNNVINEIYNNILKYVEELNLDMYVKKDKDYLFTTDLKSLSGTILHKIIFIFKLAYIKSIEKKLRIKLPIILDSPSGREIKRINVDSLINILKRDFPENQIIIASINEYNFEEVHVIELKDYLFDSYKGYNPT